MDEPRRVCSRCGKSYPAEVIFCPTDGTPLSALQTEVEDDPYLGLTVNGQFYIERLVGIGAMGRVYRAHQSGIERPVAVKILHRELLRNPTVMTRFHREAKVASRLSHPNVVQILMTGSLERASPDVDGPAYLAMEYLDGISLRSALAAAGGALPLPRALHVILQVCDAVGEAHAQGIVHRDLKPENVMLVRLGDDKDFVKVLDFGAARIASADGTVTTQAGSILGTARYISPEGAQGETVGPAGDVYSIATMLFECLAGETPFDGASPVSILVKQTSEPPPDLRAIGRASYVPEPMARLVARNLAKSPSDRCANGHELGRALLEAARAGGLRPEDLMVRSTLSDGVTALRLQSIQRTRALKLGPELSAELAEPTHATSRTATPEPPEAPQDAAIFGSDRAVPVPTASRARPALPTRLCVGLGIVVALGAAWRLGAFDRPDPDLRWYVDQANESLAAERWEAPPGRNVRDLTAAALQRWPDDDTILDVRRRAATRLVEQAAGLAAPDAATSEHLARLALELDPDSAPARALLDAATPPPASVDAHTARPLAQPLPEGRWP